MLTILHTNDFHGTLNEAMARQIAQWKAEAGSATAYFDCGDCIKAGNLSIPVKPESAWPLLALAGCDAGTLGNRESHPLTAGFRAKLAGSAHPLLVANLRQKNGACPFPGSMMIERGGVKIGLVGAMVPIITERMATKAASAYLWDSPIDSIKPLAAELRPQVDCLIALTHIGHRQDLELAEACPELDFVLGGHSHTILETPIQVGETFVCQGGSHGRYVGVYVWAGHGQLVSSNLRMLRA